MRRQLTNVLEQLASKLTLEVTSSGLSAFSDKHGLVEFRSHRIPLCFVYNYDERLFCWVYRKQRDDFSEEIRVHAAICAKGERVQFTQALITQLQCNMRRNYPMTCTAAC